MTSWPGWNAWLSSRRPKARGPRLCRKDENMGWMPFDKGASIGQRGGENGITPRDEDLERMKGGLADILSIIPFEDDPDVKRK